MLLKLDWSQMKASTTLQTNVEYPLNNFIFEYLNYNFETEKNGKTILNLGWGKSIIFKIFNR